MVPDCLEKRAAYGGAGWQQRINSMRQEIGRIWGPCGVSTEWSTLKSVLLHKPGEELEASVDPDAVQMLSPINRDIALRQHTAISAAYEQSGVTVSYVDPAGPVPPNLMFVADLMFMTPEGAVLARPASTIWCSS